MWYTQGKVSVVQGSDSVTGVGTEFADNVVAGDAFLGPDGAWYTTTLISGDLELTITPAYVGETSANDSRYATAPAAVVGDVEGDVAAALAAAIIADQKAVAAQATADTALEDAASADRKAVAAQLSADSALTAAALEAAVAADAKAEAAQFDAESALDNAATADGKAVAAQASADTALANAATADGKATEALTDADTAYLKADAAQTDADLALTNAAAAQATADAALPKSGVPVRNYTSTATSGTKAEEDIKVTLNPGANSTAVSLASRVTAEISTSRTLSPGSSVGGFQSVVNVAGTGAIDKAVGILSHINFAGTGRKESNLCFEAGIPTIPADSNIGSVCGFYFPNLAGIPNIDRIGTLAAFANQHRKAFIQNAGLYADSTLRQVVAPEHIGFAPGRYYTAPYRWLGYSGFQVGQTMLMPIYIPARTHIGFMGVGITGAVANAKCKIALYTAQDGGVGVLVGQTAEFAVATAGVKEGACDFEADGGMYWMCVMCNAAVQISTHAPQETGTRAAMFGQTDPLANDLTTLRSAYINLPYTAFPAVGGLVPNYLDNDSEVHAWLRRT